jgi:hypothetical protein
MISNKKTFLSIPLSLTAFLYRILYFSYFIHGSNLLFRSLEKNVERGMDTEFLSTVKNLQVEGDIWQLFIFKELFLLNC